MSMDNTRPGTGAEQGGWYRSRRTGRFWVVLHAEGDGWICENYARGRMHWTEAEMQRDGWEQCEPPVGGGEMTGAENHTAVPWRDLIRACGMAGPRTEPNHKMEYWSGPEAAVNAFRGLREKGLIPCLSIVYRASGQDAVGVFMDKPNEYYKPAIGTREQSALSACDGLSTAEIEALGPGGVRDLIRGLRAAEHLSGVLLARARTTTETELAYRLHEDLRTLLSRLGGTGC